MTAKNTTARKTTKSAAASKARTESAEPVAMDPDYDTVLPRGVSVAERAVQARDRTAYALLVLLDEVAEVNPDAGYNLDDRTPGGVATTIIFSDLSPEVIQALVLLEGADPRVKEVVRPNETIKVVLYPSLRTMDNRDSFGLVEAVAVLTEDEPGDNGDDAGGSE